jgi:4-hydroxybenzoate polyprenyltransferase
MEDLEGDVFDGRKTLPYIVGIQTTRVFTLFLLLSMMLFLLFIQQKMLIFELTEFLYYTVFAVQLPLLAIIMLVWQAKTKEQFTKASAFCKVLILSGVISMFVFGYFLNS